MSTFEEVTNRKRKRNNKTGASRNCQKLSWRDHGRPLWRHVTAAVIRAAVGIPGGVVAALARPAAMVAPVALAAQAPAGR